MCLHSMLLSVGDEGRDGFSEPVIDGSEGDKEI